MMSSFRCVIICNLRANSTKMQKHLYIIFITLTALACSKDADIVEIIIPDLPTTLSAQIPGDYDLDAVSYVANITVDLNGFDLPITSFNTDKNPRGDMMVTGNSLSYDGRFTLLLSIIPGVPAFPIPVNIGASGTFLLRSGNIILETNDGPVTLDVISHGPYHITFQSTTTAPSPIPLPGLDGIPLTYTLHYVKKP